MALDTRKYADYSFIGSGFSNDDGALSGWMPEQTGPMAGASGNIGAPGYGGFISGEKWWQQNKNKLGEVLENFVDLNADTTASNIPAFDTTLDDTIPKETIESTSEPTPEQIYEENKKGTVFDLIDKYPTEDGGRYPVEFVVSILKNAANQGNANAAQILSNTPVAGPEGAFDGDGPAAGTGSAQQGTTGVGDLGDVLSGDDVVTPTNNTEPKVTGRRTEPKVEVATETIPPSTMPTVSTGSVLDQTGTGDVKVDDQPAGLLNIPTSIPKQPEKKAGMIMQISQSAPIVETVFDDILFEPRFTRLDNIPDFNLPSGLLRTLV